MALSRVQYTGTGSTALYSIPFAYISKAYIEVRVGGTLLTEGAGFTWQSPTSIHLTAGNLATGVVLDIKRRTPKASKLVDFQDGSILTEASLDLSADQVFQLVQETVDDMDDRLAVQPDGTVDAQSRRIKNVSDPIDTQDAVTRNWAETALTSQLSVATLKASQAASSASDAASSAISAAESAAVAASYSGGVLGGTNTWTGLNTWTQKSTFNATVGVGQDPSDWYGVAARFAAAYNQDGVSTFGFSNSVTGVNAAVRMRLIGSSPTSCVDYVLSDNAGTPTFATKVGTAVSAFSYIFGGIEKWRWNQSGAVGLSGGNYGSVGQVLTSSGPGGAPTWNTVEGTPSGTVTFFAASAAPAGYLKANGAAVSRTTYSSLFAVIGTTYGSGDGSTTFNLPDLRGYFVRGWDDGRGVDAGRSFGSSQADSYLNHTHTATSDSQGAHTHTSPYYYGDGGSYGWQASTGANQSSVTTSTSGAHSHNITVSASTTGGTETRPKNVALLACIKY